MARGVPHQEVRSNSPSVCFVGGGTDGGTLRPLLGLVSVFAKSHGRAQTVGSFITLPRCLRGIFHPQPQHPGAFEGSFTLSLSTMKTSEALRCCRPNPIQGMGDACPLTQLQKSRFKTWDRGTPWVPLGYPAGTSGAFEGSFTLSLSTVRNGVPAPQSNRGASRSEDSHNHSLTVRGALWIPTVPRQ